MVQIEIKKKLNMAEGWRTLSVKTEINFGEFVIIFGKSGAGKSSLLRMISGLFRPDRGMIKFGSKTWFDSEEKINIRVQKRNIGFVFQQPALFPNMSIMENLQYAAGKNPDKNYLNKLLQITELKAMTNRKPQTLSGGQQQRVALIRALAAKPKLLLLDEPFSSLDVPMRQQLRDELKEIHNEFELTTLLVSHDLPPLLGIADRLIEIKDGRNSEIKDFKANRGFNNIEERPVFQGEIVGFHPSNIGFIAEILVEGEVLKIPLNKEIASHFQIGSVISFSTDRNGVHLKWD